MPDFRHEARLRAAGHLRIAGVDEVGRGPLAGPVVAAAVILPQDGIPDGIDDSKRLGPKRRTRLADEIRAIAQVGIGAAEVEEIDAVNVLQATYLAMRRAVGNLPTAPDALLIDGRAVPMGLPCPAHPVIGGDRLSLSIAAASIVAKTHRDAIMVGLAQQHPGYGWATNMGYGTPQHMMGLKRHGPTPYHRRSFRPVHEILLQGN